jgi:hypothetical protein
MSATRQDPEGIRVKAPAKPPRKVNFFIVGAPKCGTTAWFEYLRSHPDIFIPEVKEPSFFALDFPGEALVRSEAEYAQLFADGGGAKILGDASTDYLFSKAAASAIRDYNKDAKILILIRLQEEYLPSVHNEHLRLFWEEIGDFEKAWGLSGKRSPETIPSVCPVPEMLDYQAMGRFDEQVGRYLDAFPARQLLVVRFEDWVADPRAAYRQILDFLEVEDDGRADFPRVNEGLSYRSRGLVRLLTFPPPLLRKLTRVIKGVTGLRAETVYAAVRKTIGLMSAPGYKKQISPELRDEIRRYYAEDNKRLEARVRRAGVWPQQPQSAASELERQLV